jgi:uncharacterized protein (TIGR03435 family)
MKRMRTLAALIALVSGVVWGQATPAPAPLPSFEVADVRIAKPGGKHDADILPGGKLVANYVTMKELIAVAWDVRESFVTGGPAWLNSEHYDIVAKAPPNAPDKDLEKMLQSLLKERFKLELHHEMKAMPVYALVVDKKGAKLTPSEQGDPAKAEKMEPSCKLQPSKQGTDGQALRTMGCTKMGMADLAERLPRMAPAYIDLPVVDLTEIKGRYDFTLAWAPRRGADGMRGGQIASANSTMPATSDPDGLTIFGAVQKELGLKLDQRKHPMKIIVVDQVERVPTEN